MVVPTQTIVLDLVASPTAVPTPTPWPTSTVLPTATPEPPPSPMTSTAYISEDNSLIAVIEGELDRPGQVYVEYWNEEAGRFRSRTQTSNNFEFVVHIVRLRPEAPYSYQVIGTDGFGGLARGPLGSFMTGSLPEPLSLSRFNVVSGRPTHDLTYMEFGLGEGLVAIDGEAQVVWYYIPEVRAEHPRVMAQKSTGNIVYLALNDPGTAHGLVEINPLGVEVDRLPDICPPNGPMHHEVLLLSDTDVLYMSRFIVRPGYGKPPQPQQADTIWIWDQASRTNTMVWNLADFVSPSNRTRPNSNNTLADGRAGIWGGCSRDKRVQDWSHGNSVYVDDDGTVLTSFRHLNQIIAIGPDFQSVLWRLGGPGGGFKFPDPTDRFYHQHTAIPLPDDRILLFDNGNRRPRREGGQYSRALELQLDFETMTARKVWEYRHDPDIFAGCCSSVTRLENGNTLMVFGTNTDPICCKPFTIVEVAAEETSYGKRSTPIPGKRSSTESIPATR